MVTPSFATDKKETGSDYGVFVISPLPAGYGHTMGNTLRRILLSSIEGSAATSVKIKGVEHPFSTVEGIQQSVLEIILNLKQLRFKVIGEGPFIIRHSTKGKGVIKGSDLKSGDAEVVNGDIVIAEITSPKASFEMELVVEKGFGYSPSEDRETNTIGSITLDAAFSPVTKVNYTVQGERVGRRTDFDRLTLEISTDGSVKPADILKQAADIATSYFSHIMSGKDVVKQKEEIDPGARLPREVDKKVYQTIIDELDLPTRVINALLREKIETVEDLVKRGKEDLVNLKGVGRKSVDLIEKELNKLGVPFDEKEN